jgi:hypothetical protein
VPQDNAQIMKQAKRIEEVLGYSFLVEETGRCRCGMHAARSNVKSRILMVDRE